MVRVGRSGAKPSVITLADKARDARDWNLAAEYYRIALRRKPRNPPIWVQYGHVLKEAGHLPQAETAYLTAIAYDQYTADSHLHLGHVLKIQGKHEEARAAYLRAFALDPTLRGLPVEFTQLGWSESHLSELRRMLATGTTRPLASEDVDDIANSQPARPTYLKGNGFAKRFSDARPSLPAIRFRLKRHKPSVITLADRARDAGEWEIAAGYYRTALSRNPRNPPILTQYGHVLKESGDLIQAEHAYRTAIIYQPTNADAYFHLGQVLKSQGKMEEAQSSYLRAYLLEPSLSYSLSELKGLGWSKEKLAALENLLTRAGSAGATHGQLEQQERFASVNGVMRERGGESARWVLKPAKTLFPGSAFQELSVTSGTEAAKIIMKSATPADELARFSIDEYSPLISIILPIYETPARYFREVAQSVFAQTYTHWEMCIADDGSRREDTVSIRQELQRSTDPRIKVISLPQNQGIAGASQAALMQATGDYVAFVDHDDLLTPNALSEVVALLRKDPTIDYVYTDHGMADQDGFPKAVSSKPEWSPEFLLSTNYIVHLKVIRRSLLLSVGGLTREVSHAQDLGMTWRLVEANARIAHLPKPVYLWREHDNSVAATTEAKPGIEELLLHVYNRHLEQADTRAHQVWPQPFRRSRIGVFRVEFGKMASPTSLVVLMRSGVQDTKEIRARISGHIADRVDLHFVSLGEHSAKDDEVRCFTEETELSKFLASLECEFVVFINSTARPLTPKWLDDLVGYLTLDDLIGAVGGKVLDEFLRVRAGGMLVGRDGDYKTICGGEFDNSPGHWFIGQVASNVDAVSSQFLAARVKILLEGGGIRFRDYEDAWSVPFCHYLRENGYRVVYNPFSKIFDPGRLFLSKEARRRISEVGRAATTKRYYPAL